MSANAYRFNYLTPDSICASPELNIRSPKAIVAAFGGFTEYRSPTVVGYVNNHLLRVVKLKGELVWHAHDEQGELFYIVKVSLRIEFKECVMDPERGLSDSAKWRSP